MPRIRSPRFPSIGLEEAVSLTNKLFSRARQHPVGEDVAVKAMGYKNLHGAARVKLAALRRYGLLEDSSEGVAVSDLAMRIIFPQTDQERREAVLDAAHQPDIFRELLPQSDAADDVLRSQLIRRGFSQDAAQQAVAAFRETFRMVGDVESPTPRAEPAAPLSERERAVMDSLAGGTRPRERSAAQPTSFVFVWPLPQNKQAEVRLSGGPLTREDVSFLRRYLDLAELTVTERTEPNGEPTEDDEASPAD